jgi:hypothetical protein
MVGLAEDSCRNAAVHHRPLRVEIGGVHLKDRAIILKYRLAYLRTYKSLF